MSKIGKRIKTESRLMFIYVIKGGDEYAKWLGKTKDENILKLDCGNSYTTLENNLKNKTTKLYILNL